MTPETLKAQLLASHDGDREATLDYLVRAYVELRRNTSAGYVYAGNDLGHVFVERNRKALPTWRHRPEPILLDSER